MDEDKKKDLSLKKLIKRYLSHIEVEKNYSKYTLRNYEHYLNFFASWFSRKYEQEYIQRLTSEIVRRYRLHLARFEDDKGKRLGVRTQSYYIIALRAFLKYLAKKGHKSLAAEKVDLPKLGDRKIEFLSREQVERLLNQPVVDDTIGLRDRAILETLFSTGLRVGELAKINRDQIDFKSREFGVVGKGRRARIVFLSRRAAGWLSRYLGARDDDWKPVWVRFSGKQADVITSGESMRLSVRGIQRIVEKYRKLAGVPIKVTPHILRHSYATTLLSSGADLRSVQEMLGHKNVATTQIYTHVTNPQLKQTHEKYLK